MNVKLAYLGHSGLSAIAGGQLLNLAPNLAREPVSLRIFTLTLAD